MGVNKLERFEQVKSFGNFFYHSYLQSMKGSELKGNWSKQVFKNNNPIVLELGCGKGEYTVGLAKKYSNKNFIGVDIKSNRIWKGAKEALETNIENAAFLHTRINFIDTCFAENEVSEIWITFPDPQPQKPRARSRLTHPLFLTRYKNIVRQNSTIHLKTDSESLFKYTLEVINDGKLNLIHHTFNLYEESNPLFDDAKSIQTYYESIYLKERVPIKYLVFTL